MQFGKMVILRARSVRAPQQNGVGIRMEAKHTLGEPRVLISRSALLHNAGLIRKTIPAGTRICAILKADAYGHDAWVVADALCNYSADISNSPAVDAVAVANLDEAAALPEIKVPVIVFRPLENAFLGRQRYKFEQAVRNGWVLTLCSAAGANDLARIAVAAGKWRLVQVMVDTGMTRAGVDAAHLPDLLHRIGAHPSLQLVGVCTHFSNSEQQHCNYTLNQLGEFRRAIDPYQEAFRGRSTATLPIRGPYSSCRLHFEMVRPGISLYGIDPTGTPSVQRALRPVMKWTAAFGGREERSPRRDRRLRPHLDREARLPDRADSRRVCRRIPQMLFEQGEGAGARQAGAGGRSNQHGPDDCRPDRSLAGAGGRRGNPAGQRSAVASECVCTVAVGRYYPVRNLLPDRQARAAGCGSSRRLGSCREQADRGRRLRDFAQHIRVLLCH